VSPGTEEAVSTAKATTSPGDPPATIVASAGTAPAPHPTSPMPDSSASPPQVSSTEAAPEFAGPGELTRGASGGSRGDAHSATHRGRPAYPHRQPPAQAEKQWILSAAMDRAHREKFSDSFESLRRWVRLCPGSEQEGPARVAQCPHERRSGARGRCLFARRGKAGVALSRGFLNSLRPTGSWFFPRSAR
jgi:hypothetical protein